MQRNYLFNVNISAVVRFLRDEKSTQPEVWPEWESAILEGENPGGRSEIVVSFELHRFFMSELRLLHDMMWASEGIIEGYVTYFERAMQQHFQRESHFTSACLHQEISYLLQSSLYSSSLYGSSRSVLIVNVGISFTENNYLFDNRPLKGFSVLASLKALQNL